MWGSTNTQGCSAGCLTCNAQWGSEAPGQGPGRGMGVVAMGVGNSAQIQLRTLVSGCVRQEQSLTGPVLPTS